MNNRKPLSGITALLCLRTNTIEWCVTSGQKLTRSGDWNELSSNFPKSTLNTTK
ncbi:MAG: hypothetical protein O2971_13175 [Proteobacteria bacterium]|nr:hypothetical protein [Pseudomonadota bacterium]